MSEQAGRLLLGLVLGAAIAAGAWRAQALTAQGALGAAVLGTLVFGLGGLGWAVVLMGFFVSSSALSRFFRKRKARLEEKFSKGAQRDLGQVLANGGVAGVFVVLHALFPDAAWPWIGFCGAFAAANADTWATELGVLSRSTPKLITTGQSVERGTSGGVTALGLLASFSGAGLIALLGILFWQGSIGVPPPDAAAWALWITLAGLAGSLFDSALGATVQAIYFCPACVKETERHPLHTCGTPTVLARGWWWMDNDWVNALCTLLGALLSAAAVWAFA